MTLIFFENPTKVRSSGILEELFGATGIHFEKGAVVTFIGKAFLSNGIHFRGQCEIDDGVSIDVGCVLQNVSIGSDTNVRSYSILNNSRFGKKNISGATKVYIFLANERACFVSRPSGEHKNPIFFDFVVNISPPKVNNTGCSIKHHSFCNYFCLQHP